MVGITKFSRKKYIREQEQKRSFDSDFLKKEKVHRTSVKISNYFGNCNRKFNGGGEFQGKSYITIYYIIRLYVFTYRFLKFSHLSVPKVN